MVELYH